MRSLRLIVDVMFAIYIVQFISAFLNGFTENRPRLRLWLDLFVGVLLLALVVYLD